MLLKNPESTSLAAGDFPRPAPHQFARNNPQQRAQLEHVPGIAPQDGQRRSGLGQRIAFARDGFDQRGLAAPVRSQDGDVLPRPDGERNVVEHSFAAQHDGHVAEIQQRGTWGGNH